MSFILDALKKSESDRQRQSGPSLFEVKVAPPRRRLPVWAVAIAVLLGINIIVISWMLLRRPAGQPGQAQQAQQPAQPLAAQPPAAVGNAAAAPPSATVNPAGTQGTPSTPAGGKAPVAAQASSAVASSAAAPPAAPPNTASSSRSPASSTSTSNDDQNAGEAVAARDPNDDAPAVEPAGAHSAGATAATDGLPLYQQIVTSDGLPALHLDLHVFADRPQDRFVMINMHRLGEGDSLPEGVQVESIRPDGAVLTYHGIRFLLPRN